MSGGPEHPAKLLFVCSRNRRRSLTAERILEGLPGYEVRSAGTQPEARIVVTEGHIGWADMIFVMEKSHLNRLWLRFPEALAGKRVVALHIRDDYELISSTNSTRSSRPSSTSAKTPEPPDIARLNRRSL